MLKKLNWLDWVLIVVFILGVAGSGVYFLKPKVNTEKTPTVAVEITAEATMIEFPEQKDYLEGYSGEVTIGEAKIAKAMVEKVAIEADIYPIPNLETGEITNQVRPGTWKAVFTLTAQATKTEKGYVIDGGSVAPGAEYLFSGKGLSTKATIKAIKEVQ